MDEEIRGGRERALARGASAYFRAPANADNGSPAGRARSLARGASAYFKFTAAMEGEDEGSSAVRERALARGASATYIPPSEGRPRAENGHALVDTLDEAPPTPWTALWVASCVLTSLFGFLLGSLAYAHATAHTKPDSSQLFRLQQEVAGALVIMAHFREAAVIGCAACGVGCLTAWSAKPHLLWTSLVSLLGGTAYFAVMAAAAHLIGESADTRASGIAAALFYGCAMWRGALFLPKWAHTAVAAAVALVAVSVGALYVRMEARAGELEPLLARARQISHHVRAHPGYAWPVGADAPVGFNEASASKGGWWWF